MNTLHLGIIRFICIIPTLPFRGHHQSNKQLKYFQRVYCVANNPYYHSSCFDPKSFKIYNIDTKNARRHAKESINYFFCKFGRDPNRNNFIWPSFGQNVTLAEFCSQFWPLFRDHLICTIKFREESSILLLDSYY